MQRQQMKVKPQQRKRQRRSRCDKISNMISIVINSWNEPTTIGKTIKCIVDPKYSGIANEFEVIQVSPDDATLEAGLKAALDLKVGSRFFQIKDPLKGKPFALRMAFQKARGDILIMTDGDTYFGKGTVKKLLFPLFRDKRIGGVTGRPVSLNSRKTMFGYISHLLTDSAHHRRIKITKNMGEYTTSGKNFFPMSGYIIAMKNIVALPDKVLADDAYISYEIRNKGFEIAYVPSALVYVKFPTTLKDYFLQKVRSIGGYVQIKRMGTMKKDKQSRSFWIELTYALFVFTYPKNIREFIWSLALFPIRLWTWVIIFYQQVIKKSNIPKKGWERIESTK